MKRTMRWRNKTIKPPGCPDWLLASWKIHEAFEFGFINRTVLEMAMNKVKQKRNGTWMFVESELK
jgi:hypothetical protein